MMIFLGLITASILSFVYKDQAKESLSDGFDTALDKYGRDDTYTEDMDFIQETV